MIVVVASAVELARIIVVPATVVGGGDYGTGNDVKFGVDGHSRKNGACGAWRSAEIVTMADSHKIAVIMIDGRINDIYNSGIDISSGG